MIKKWDEQLADFSKKLSDLSAKVADASEEVKAAGVLQKEAFDNKVSTARGNVEAFKENMRIDKEEDEAKLQSSLLQAQMTIEAKLQDFKDKRDKKHLEKYIDHQIKYIADTYETGLYLLANCELAILETLSAVDEYEKRFGGDKDAEE